MTRVHRSIAVLALALVTAASGQTSRPQETPDARPGAPLDARFADRVRDLGDTLAVDDVIFSEARNDAGQSVLLRMDVVFPRETSGRPLPVVVYVHGGRWRVGGRATGREFAEVFARGGYFAATIDYRLADEAKFPAAVHDVKAAIRFLRDHANELGINPNRIGIWGHAVGGHLSALAATSANTLSLQGPPPGSSAVRCAASVAGPTDLTADVFGPQGDAIIAYWLGAERVADVPALARVASPLTHVDANDPPMFVVHGTADPQVPFTQAEAFVAALRAAGVECELLPIEGAGHRIEDSRFARRIARFFDEHLAGAAAPVIDAIMPADSDGGPDDRPDDRPDD